MSGQRPLWFWAAIAALDIIPVFAFYLLIGMWGVLLAIAVAIFHHAIWDWPKVMDWEMERQVRAAERRRLAERERELRLDIPCGCVEGEDGVYTVNPYCERHGNRRGRRG